MAVPTNNEQLAAMQFGYLRGSDLMRWISPQLLISRETVLPGSLNEGCETAYSEVIGLFRTKYNVSAEIYAISGTRDEYFAKVVGIMAVRNIASNLAGIGPVTEANFKWADDTIASVRGGTSSFSLQEANALINSGSFLVKQNFGTIG